MTSITSTRTINSITCGACGILFGLESAFMRKRQDDGRSFYCPNGDKIGWEAANKHAAVEQQLQAAEAREVALKDQLAAAVHDAEQTRQALLRDRARFAVGVCPCCNRSFDNVRRHMATKHPEYDVTKVAQHGVKFRCTCGRKFESLRGLRTHQGRARRTSGSLAWDKPGQSPYWAHLTRV